MMTKVDRSSSFFVRNLQFGGRPLLLVILIEVPLNLAFLAGNGKLIIVVFVVGVPVLLNLHLQILDGLLVFHDLQLLLLYNALLTGLLHHELCHDLPYLDLDSRPQTLLPLCLQLLQVLRAAAIIVILAERVLLHHLQVIHLFRDLCSLLQDLRVLLVQLFQSFAHRLLLTHKLLDFAL